MISIEFTDFEAFVLMGVFIFLPYLLLKLISHTVYYKIRKYSYKEAFLLNFYILMVNSITFLIIGLLIYYEILFFRDAYMYLYLWVLLLLMILEFAVISPNIRERSQDNKDKLILNSIIFCVFNSALSFLLFGIILMIFGATI